MQNFEVIVLDEARNSAGLGWRYFGEKILKVHIFCTYAECTRTFHGITLKYVVYHKNNKKFWPPRNIDNYYCSYFTKTVPRIFMTGGGLFENFISIKFHNFDNI
jgi:hypothetical protein